MYSSRLSATEYAISISAILSGKNLKTKAISRCKWRLAVCSGSLLAGSSRCPAGRDKKFYTSTMCRPRSLRLQMYIGGFRAVRALLAAVAR